MSYQDEYRKWLEDPWFDDETKAELKAIEGDEKEIREYPVEELHFKPKKARGRKSKDKQKDPEEKELKELENLPIKKGV